MGKGKDLTERERFAIEYLLQEKKSIKQISDILDRHYQTIYKEIKKGTVELIDTELRKYKKYCADRGQALAEKAKHEKGRELKLASDLEFVRFLEMMILEKRYSPCAILAYIKNHNLKFKTEVCYTTIYNYIEKGLLLNVTNKDLPIKSKRKKRNIRKISSVCLNNLKGNSIENRESDVLSRADFGHWEMDTVVGGKYCSKDCLLVLTERKTRYEYIIKIPDKSQYSVVNALDDLERVYGFENFCSHFKTITVDNGCEFLDMKGIERSGIEYGQNRTVAYYCHPYCSFERGSNENQNKLVRRWIPKGSDIGAYTEDYISMVQDWINEYPRKLFGYLSSKDVLKAELG